MLLDCRHDESACPFATDDSSSTLPAVMIDDAHRQKTSTVLQLLTHAAGLKLLMELQMQVQSPAGGWQPVMLEANQVAVFAGETLQHATAGRIPAAAHRVFLDPATNQTGVRRMYILPIVHPSALHVT